MIQHSHCDAMNVYMYILSRHMHKPLISRKKISVDYLE